LNQAVKLIALTTAVPRYILYQDDVTGAAREQFGMRRGSGALSDKEGRGEYEVVAWPTTGLGAFVCHASCGCAGRAIRRLGS